MNNYHDQTSDGDAHTRTPIQTATMFGHLNTEMNERAKKKKIAHIFVPLFIFFLPTKSTSFQRCRSQAKRRCLARFSVPTENRSHWNSICDLLALDLNTRHGERSRREGAESRTLPRNGGKREDERIQFSKGPNCVALRHRVRLGVSNDDNHNSLVLLSVSLRSWKVPFPLCELWLSIVNRR